MKNPVNGIPTIVDIYEEDNHLIVIEHFISGLTLSDIIENHTLTIDNIVQIILELCNILEPLHNQQPPIVHRDIKPSNVIITEYGHAILLDFNAAKYYKNPDSNDTILLGTKGYAAPEQYGFGSSSPKTDIYALGILLREMVNSINSNYNKDFENIIATCTKLNPDDRYSCVSLLKDTLLQMCASKEQGTAYIKSNKKTNTNTIINATADSKVNNSLFKSNETPKNFIFRRFLPPGYRTLTPLKMLYATLGYAFLIWMTCSLEFNSSSTGEPVPFVVALIQKIFIFLMTISIIFFNSNYLDIRKHFPICNHKKPLIRYIGMALINVAIVFTLFIIMAILILIIR